MKEIVLKDGTLTTVDDEDFDRLNQYVWRNTGGYPTRWCPDTKRPIWLHRDIMGDPAGMVVDHIDRDPLNNTRANLRVVTKSEDLKNRKPYKRGAPLKPLDASQDRYVATPLLAQIVELQGRRKTWLGEQIHVSRSQVSHVLAGRRTVTESDARIWAGILGISFDALWKLAKRSKMDQSDEQREAMSA